MLRDILIGAAAGILANLSGPYSVIGVLVGVGLIVYVIVNWHLRRMAAGKRGVDSWYFISSAMLIAAICLGAACYGLGLRSTLKANEAKQATVNIPDKSTSPAYVANIQLGLSGGGNPTLIVANFESAVSGLMRVYIEYSVLGTELSKPIKIMIANFANTFRGQRLDVTVLRRNYYLDKAGEKHWDFRFGPEGTEQNNSSFMADFKYKTRLIFEGPDGGDQFYNFQIVPPDKIEENWTPKITTQDDIKPW